MSPPLTTNSGGLKLIAILEATKGLFALLVGLGVHELASKDLQQFAERLVGHLHLNPASHYPGVFIHALGAVKDSNLVFIAIGALAYGVVRFIEAYGLWRGYRWTEWFALLSGAVYMPFEVYEAFTHTSLISLLVLVINAFIILYMLKVVMKKHHACA
tara:strand:- start:2777 stop:3250 length:474 start_codon:yes stop_codon:yes gene_type:complete